MSKYEILAYRGFGNGTRARFYGRVVETLGVSVSSDRDSLFRNLINTLRRVDSDPLGVANVSVTYASNSIDGKADDEGFCGGWIDAVARVDQEWTSYVAELVTANDSVQGTGEMLVPAPTATFGVVSDIDDTVIQSRVSNFLQAARTVMLGNARTRLPFPGVAAFYRALRNGGGGDEKNPIYYVSSSPWNIYGVIAEFMDVQKIPRGPILLRDWDIGWGTLSSTRHFDHKGTTIRNIMHTYPTLPFILIGDTSH